MAFELFHLFLLSLGYLLALFGIAHAAEKGWVPQQLIRHPITYLLSLCVFACAWSFFGAVSLAHAYGYGFLAYYLGLTVAFLLSSLLLIPLWRLSRTYMLSSLADIFCFRFRSQLAGTLVTVLMLFAILPFLALQIQAIAETALILSPSEASGISKENINNLLALAFCLIVGIFTMLFGAKHLTAHQRHDGLVTAVAFSSLVKLVILLTLAGVAISSVFGGFDGLSQWLNTNSHVTARLNTPLQKDLSRTSLIIFFSTTIVMPHFFHMIITENTSPKTLRVASWGAPLLLLLISLPVLPILWSGYSNNTSLLPEYFIFSVGLDLNKPWLSLLTFIGGISAASSVIIVITLALASMCLKHLILPFYRPDSVTEIHRWLLRVKRTLIFCIILAGYIFYRIMDDRVSLQDLGLAAFIAALQFFPGVFATLYWQRANRQGFITGLCIGFGVWLIALLIPIVSETASEWLMPIFASYYSSNIELWHVVTLISLALNCSSFVLVSLLTTMNPDEKIAAEACSTDDLSRPIRRLLSVQNAREMEERLISVLGKRSAHYEMHLALNELGLDYSENRPFALRMLRNRLEANLSSMLGPSVASETIEQLLPYEESSNSGRTEDINLIEGQLERRKSHLTGLAADLDSLRRHHRKTLQELPVGVCSLSQDQEVLMWNNAIAELTQVPAEQTLGASLSTLPHPWQDILSAFSASPEAHRLKEPLKINGQNHWVNMHKSTGHDNDQIIVLEDATEIQNLEQSLRHRERLAAIGQLAAGVAHEIGNPVTGIACLAQNLRYDTENPESLNTAKEIISQTQRVTRIVQTLVNFAHTGTPSESTVMENINLHRCIDEAIHLVTLDKDAKPIQIHNQCEAELYAAGDQQRLLQVLINLINNARDASPTNSNIWLTAQSSASYIELSVSDQGSGIDQTNQEKIFDPFFTTKETGKGTGLGLYLVYNIIQDMEGQIRVESPYRDDQSGTRFTLSLRHSLDPD